ncbi:MAG: hypothetical protein PHG66_01695 [Candidatus Colwellbacteria bacterium]|nr:hypothetical protein [Candidatus Colwellbacteria bacterium]
MTTVIFSKEQFEFCIRELIGCSKKCMRYYALDSRTRKRNEKNGTDLISDIRNVIVNICRNKIPTTHKSDFFDMIDEYANKGYLICNYVSNKDPMTIVCRDYHHNYTITKVHLIRRIDENKLPCGECEQNTRSNNSYLTSQVSKTIERIKEYVHELKSEYFSYDSVKGVALILCPHCKKKINVGRNYLVQKRWKSCVQCSNTVSGNKYTQQEIESIFSKKGVYVISKYENKDIPVLHNCPGCMEIIGSTLRDIKLRSIILCTSCRYRFTLDINDKTLDKYGIFYNPIIEERENLKCVKPFYCKEERSKLDRWGVDLIPVDKWREFFQKDIIFGNSVYKKKRRECNITDESFEKSKKSNMKMKEFIAPNGRIFNVDGYESNVLKHLVNYISEENIITDSRCIPVISYKYFDGERKYFPDFYIPEYNLLIEVKSLRTYYDNSDKNIMKMLYSFYTGYNVELWIVSKKYTYILFLSHTPSGMNLYYKIILNNNEDEYLFMVDVCKGYLDNKYYINKKGLKVLVISEWIEYKRIRSVVNDIFKPHENIHTLNDRCKKLESKTKTKLIEIVIESDVEEEKEEKVSELVEIIMESESDDDISFESVGKYNTDDEIIVPDLSSYFEAKTFHIPREITTDIMMSVMKDGRRFDKIVDVIMKHLEKYPSFISCRKWITDEELFKRYDTGIMKSVTVDENDVLISNTKFVGFLNYFVMDEILKVKTGSRKRNIHDTWDDHQTRRKLVEDTFKNKDLKVFTPMSIESKYSYRESRAYNFPVNIACHLYNKYGGERVLDFSSGFGGRLIGFWKSNAKEYVGIDPNKNIDYNSILKWVGENDPQNKKVSIIRKPAEDVDFSTLGKFNFVFTSPPYYDLEVYSSDESQSVSRYKTYSIWLDKFLKVVIDKSIHVLEIGGYLAINIQNIKKYNIADDMCRYLDDRKELIRKEDIVYKKSTKTKKNLERIYLYHKLT